MKHNFYHLELKEGLPVLVKEDRTYEADKRVSYTSPERVYDLCKGIGLDRMAEEYVYAVYLNTACKLIGFTEITHGTISVSLISPREILQKALFLGASNIIVIHNHPSGNTNPSKQDKDATQKLEKACNLIGISLLDHIIIGDDYYSFKGNNLL